MDGRRAALSLGLDGDVIVRGALFAVAIAIAPGSSRADAPKPAIDLPLLGLGLTGTMAAFVETPRPSCLPSCTPPAGLNAIDRTALGNHSRAAHTAADVIVAGLLVAPLIVDLVDSGGDGYLEDLVVFGQTILFAQATTHLTKAAVRRGAPILYDASVPLEERERRDASHSFISGHTTTAFAAASAATTTFFLRNPNSPWRWVVLGVTHALAAATGFLKVQAGYHFWSDVGAGALAGASIGVLVPALHRF